MSARERVWPRWVWRSPRPARRVRLAPKPIKPLRGQRQCLLFLRKTKADEVPAGGRIAEKAGAGHGGHADLVDKMRAQGDIVAKIESVDRAHDVVRAFGYETAKAHLLE